MMEESFLFYEELPDGTAAVSGAPEGRRRIIIPETIGGMTVSAIAAHAFADREDIREIVLPGTVRFIGNYAFHYCSRLEHLLLTDSVEEYGDGVIRVCSSLSLIDITMQNGRWRLLREMTGDTDAELFFRLSFPDGRAELLFPKYYNAHREDPWARAIHQSIVGAGYAYRQCVSRTGIDYRQYDACFTRIAQVDPLTGGRIALARLMEPYRLQEKAAALYRDYLPEAAEMLIPYLTEQADASRIRFLLRNADIPRHLLEEGAGLASDRGLTEICSLFMDQLGRQEGAAGMASFDLDDWE